MVLETTRSNKQSMMLHESKEPLFHGRVGHVKQHVLRRLALLLNR